MYAALPRVITPANAELLGITRSRVRTEVRRGAWQTLAAGVVLARPDEPTREDWADVGIAVAGPGSAVSSWDAMRSYGVGDERRPSFDVLVLSPSGLNRSIGGVRIRPTNRAYEWTRKPEGARLGSLPVVGPARAAADCALDLAPNTNAVRALVGRTLQLRLCTLADLVAEYENGPRNRSGALRAALADAADGARSVAEAQAVRHLVRGRAPAFEVNVPVVDQYGRLLYELDLLWRALRAGIEIDSRKHHSGLADWEGTMARHNAVTGFRLALLHYPPRAITRAGSSFVADVARFLHDRADELGVPMPTTRGVIRPPAGESPPPLVVHCS